MSSRLVPIRARELIRVLESFGFAQMRQVGSHVRMVHPDGRRTSVPVHAGEEIRVRLLQTILRQAQLDRDDYIERVAEL